MAQPSVALRRAVLDQVPPGIRKPRYDAARVGPGTVEALAYHGLDIEMHVRTNLAPKPFQVRVAADAADRRPVAPGETVEIGWDAADQRIFAA